MVMSNLQLGLAIAGGLVLAAVVAHGAWTSRKNAPLDDANTERYAKLVSSMSKETQFLFISHNKIAMEMAEQLIGVTMQEQGVSRIVAVDMEAAVSLAELA